MHISRINILQFVKVDKSFAVMAWSDVFVV